MFIKSFVLVFILLGVIISNSLAQNMPPDSLLYSKAATQVIDHFNTVIAYQSEIFNGTLYELAPPANKGSFYFQDKNYTTPGLIHYNGTWYKNVPVLYDVHNDVMVSSSGNNLYILSTEKIRDIYLSDHHFIYIGAQNQDNVTPGFYDLLYNGKSQVLIKRTKTVNEHILPSHTIETFYEDKSEVYVKKGDKYYLIDSKGSLLDMLKDKKKELKQFIKDNKIDYNTDKEGATVKSVGYYDQISN